ncbi:phosphotransferase family protein [Rhodococcus opacus]|uniref:phosphotransferase family protein n=2 Tax=Rhodococcus opacus TaxID=37919 RepID=UPI001F5798BF|nr:ecdysteroid 22-kinase family protein [Rhodococcus opacus]MDJ0420400.1 phosphotransferase [Rhodococcus opacus]MDV7088130.1 phosphotransferase [Rhodococcus opacus]UNN04706.1 ecdysteroid 22-kinase family protein [Rhodococcus opacus]WKN52502.1 phosphotransferase [Rhodococcus opacus]
MNPTTLTEPSMAGDIAEALRAGGSLPEGGNVEQCRALPLGAGQLADSYRVELTYTPGPSGPSSVFVKLPPSDTHSAATASRIGAFDRERFFYAELRPRLDIRTPRFLGSLPRGDGPPGLILQDLSSSTRPLDQLRDGTIEQVESVADQLAGLQAPFWDDEDAVGGTDRFYNRTEAHITGLAERYEQSWHRHRDTVGALLDPQQRQLIETFGHHCLSWASGIRGPRTLVHQDLRLDNLLWGDAGAWIVDWQTLAWTSPAWDLAFFLGTALDPDTRRRVEQRLLEAHVSALHDRGVQGWDIDTAEREHWRLSGSVLIAMVAALAFVQPTARGFEMFASLIHRGAQQALDHDLLSFI